MTERSTGRRLAMAMADRLPPAMVPGLLRAARRVRNASWAPWRSQVRLRARDVTGRMDTTSCLVLAPHPDDEALGCAATIARKRHAGAQVTVVVATDGAAAKGAVDVAGNGGATRLVAARRRELHAACGQLGVPPDRIVELGHPDGDLGDHHLAVVAQLRELVATTEPDEVLVTWRRDPHNDHRALSAALDVALVGHPEIQHLEYPVHAWVRGPWDADPPRHWTRRIGRSITDRFVTTATSAVVAVRVEEFAVAKRAALAAYGSQLTARRSDATWGALGPEFVAPFLGDHEYFFAIDHTGDPGRHRPAQPRQEAPS